MNSCLFALRCLSALFRVRYTPSIHRLCSLVCAISLGAPATIALAQSLNDGYAPVVNGVVNAIIVQADGMALIGGNFTMVNNQLCSYLCRVRVDGSIDPNFVDPLVNGSIRAVALLPNGDIVIGGAFTQVAFQNRGYFAHLDHDGVLKSNYPDLLLSHQVTTLAVQADGKILIADNNPTSKLSTIVRLNGKGQLDAGFITTNANGAITALVMQPDSTILVAGGFTSIGGIARSRVARLNADGRTDPSFADPGANDIVHALVRQDDGSIMVAGAFTGIGGRAATRIACLDTGGRLMPTTTFVDPNVNATITALIVQADGTIVIGGDFTAVGGQTRLRLARLSPDGNLDDFYSGLSVNARVAALAEQADGNLLVGGDFTTGLSPHLARLNVDGSVDHPFYLSGVDRPPIALAVRPEGKVFIGGDFTTIGGQIRNSAARLNANGFVDTTFAAPDFNRPVRALVAYEGGKVLAGGEFWMIGTQKSSKHFVRLNADGSLDLGFDPGSGAIYDDLVKVMALQADGKLLVGGQFSYEQGHRRRSVITRVNADGSVDSGFVDFSYPDAPYDVVFTLALQANGKILVGGKFLTSAQSPERYLARLNTDGTLDADFVDPGASYFVDVMLVQPDEKVLVGGEFETIGGQARRYLARLNADGSLDASFVDPGLSGPVYSFALQADGKILVAVRHTTVGGQSDRSVVRLNADGGLDTSFVDPGVGRGLTAITALAQRPDGRLLAAGQFTAIDGQSSDYLARISVPEAAIQSLQRQGTNVTWMRGGTSPELVLPPLLSVSANCDGNYAQIGTMTRIAGGWQLAGAPLPSGWSCLRTQGRTSSGKYNDSQGLVESVRRIWRDDHIFRDGFQ